MRAVGFFRAPQQTVPAAQGNPDLAAEIRLYCERNHHQLVNTYAVGNGVSAEDAFASITEMFRGGRIAQAAYRLYAEQIRTAVNKGLAGEKTTASDVDGNCAATFSGSVGAA